MSPCPICTTPAIGRHSDTPYHVCAACGCWWQSPVPAKLYHGPEEPGVDVMPDNEKAANRGLAEHLFLNVIGGRPRFTLDIGCKIPYLAHCLRTHHRCVAWAMDPQPVTETLGVPILKVDFETTDTPSLHKFGLITLIHVFEHFADPIAALRKLRKLIAEDGRVFLRLPDHTVPGWERDLTAHHYTIHPFFHALTSIAEALAQLGDAFVMESQNALAPGQRDIVLRPIIKRPTIGVGMIVKDEERDLPRMLRSVESVADGIVVVDTGSTDRTLVVAHTTIDKPIWSRTYLGASQRDADGVWRLQNFAQARNEYLREIGERGFDWCLWMDADDEILTPMALRRVAYLPPAAYGVWVELGGGLRQVHHRLFPARSGVRFKGWCHEYLVMDSLPAFVLNDACIRHDATPHGSETSNARNLRILEAEYAAEPSARTAFYLANTHKDAGRWQEAAHWYHVRLGYGDAWRDEYLFAVLYLVRALRACGNSDGAFQAVGYGVAIAPEWQEFRMELAFHYYQRQDYAAAIEHATQALGKPIPQTPLWREAMMYRDQPARLISWCHEHLGNLHQALEWSRQATALLGAAPDAEWARREALLAARLAPREAPAVIVPQRRRIALHRPGAIGDILMTLNLVPALREAEPDAELHYFCDGRLGQFDALGRVMMQAGVDLIMDSAHLGTWRGNYARTIDLVGYPMHEGYPYTPMRRHLLEYFAAEVGVEPVLHALSLPRPRAPLKGLPKHYATLQVKAGWSPYKNWLLSRWAEVVAQLPDIPFVQIGAAGEPLVGDTVNLTGRTLHDAIALVANASMHVGVDSFANHLTHYFWTDARGGRKVQGVILWGSTQASAAGYPDNVNITRALACQPCFREAPEISRQRTDPCPNQSHGMQQCMLDISVGEVVDAIQTKWRALGLGATEPELQGAA